MLQNEMPICGWFLPHGRRMDFVREGVALVPLKLVGEKGAADEC